MKTILNVVCLVLAGTTAGYSAGLAGNSVGTAQLKNGAVTTPKLKKNAVTTQKLKPSAVDGSRIKDGSVGAADLATGVVPVGTMTRKQDLALGTSTEVLDVAGLLFEASCTNASPDTASMVVTSPAGEDPTAC